MKKIIIVLILISMTVSIVATQKLNNANSNYIQDRISFLNLHQEKESAGRLYDFFCISWRENPGSITTLVDTTSSGYYTESIEWLLELLQMDAENIMFQKYNLTSINSEKLVLIFTLFIDRWIALEKLGLHSMPVDAWFLEDLIVSGYYDGELKFLSFLAPGIITEMSFAIYYDDVGQWEWNDSLAIEDVLISSITLSIALESVVGCSSIIEHANYIPNREAADMILEIANQVLIRALIMEKS